MHLIFVGFARHDVTKGAAVHIETARGLVTAAAGCDIRGGQRLYVDEESATAKVYTSEYLPRSPLVVGVVRLVFNWFLFLLSPIWLPILFVVMAIQGEQGWMAGRSFIWETNK